MQANKKVLTEKVLQKFRQSKIVLEAPVGTEYILHRNIWAEPFASFTVHGFCSMGAFSYAWSKLNTSTCVGRYCSIAGGVQIMGDHHPLDWLSTHPFSYNKNLWYGMGINRNAEWSPTEYDNQPHPVQIGHDVWIGQNVLLRDGITLHTGSVVAAGSVVTKDVPPYAIVGGNPARIIRYRFPEVLIERLLESKWWEYHFGDFSGFDLTKPEIFLEQFYEAVMKGKIQKFQPDKINIYDLFD